ncbi:MAG: hypothetical protein GQ477_00160 [Nanohaloarchaea archaeon]|nr:hypothetical protein [Candidatus Nanohaloarchaea archaeon]
MSLENVSGQIMVDVENRIKAIDVKTKAEAEVILTEAKKNSEELIDRAKAKAEVQIAALDKKELASASLESKRPLLDAKRQLIEKTYSDVTLKISQLDATTRKTLLKNLISESLEQMPDAKKVYVKKSDMSLVKPFAKKMQISEKEMLGGIIIENGDGTVRIDNSFDMLLDTMRKDTLKETADILFR